MSGALRVLQHTAEQAEQRAEFVSETTRSIEEQIAAEQTRATLLTRAIGQNQRYDDTQRQIEDSVERLRQKNEALRLGATPEQISSLDAILQRYRMVEAQTEALNDAIRRQAADQQERHDLVADGIHGIGRAFLDMAAKGKFSFRTLLEAANDFADRIQV
jgi:murein L,D-transpeptidase YcbB/YkuD